jgi:hypothetical protein
MNLTWVRMLCKMSLLQPLITNCHISKSQQLHIIKLEPQSLDNEKIKKKRERRRYNMGERKCKKAMTVGLAVTHGWLDQPPTS